MDRIEKIGGSLVQMGDYNDRIYLMKLDPEDLPGLLDRLESLRERSGYSKIFAKIPESHEGDFERRGYEVEARVPDFYRGQCAALFLGWYATDRRRTDERAERVREVIAIAEAKRASAPTARGESSAFTFERARPEDVGEMAAVYRQVFATYPFPILEPDYLRQTMESHVDYYCARRESRIVALSSVERDDDARCAEMTDFATLPEHRGSGLAVQLMHRMEHGARDRGIITAYTIARSLSVGMNVTFARAGYALGGTLINNTNISGSIESMNVWYKRLSGA